MPCKNKLDVLYFVVAKFYVAATGLARTILTYGRKTTTWYSDCFLIFRKNPIH